MEHFWKIVQNQDFVRFHLSAVFFRFQNFPKPWDRQMRYTGNRTRLNSGTANHKLRLIIYFRLGLVYVWTYCLEIDRENWENKIDSETRSRQNFVSNVWENRIDRVKVRINGQRKIRPKTDTIFPDIWLSGNS